MQKHRDLANDLDRLLASSTMFTVQELQRTTFGDDEDYEDTKEEISTVVDQVSETIEKNLDEDLLARLDRGEYPRVASALRCWPSLLSWRSIWPYWNYNMYYGGRSWIRPINRGNGGNKAIARRASGSAARYGEYLEWEPATYSRRAVPRSAARSAPLMAPLVGAISVSPHKHAPD